MMRKRKLIGILSILLAMMFFVGAEEASAQRAELFWEGRIDDRANLVIRGRTVNVRTISGQRNGRGRYNWTRTDRSNQRPGFASVSRRDGRGSVQLIQQPSRYNSFTTIVRIEDLKGGADNYKVRVRWN